MAGRWTTGEPAQFTMHGHCGWPTAVDKHSRFCSRCGAPLEDLYQETVQAAETPSKTATASSGRRPSPAQRQKVIDAIGATLAGLDGMTDLDDVDPPRRDPRDLQAGDRRLAQAEDAEAAAAERLRAVLDQVDATQDPMYRAPTAGDLSERVRDAKLSASRGQLGLNRAEIDMLLTAHEEWYRASLDAKEARQRQNQRLQGRR